MTIWIIFLSHIWYGILHFNYGIKVEEDKYNKQNTVTKKHTISTTTFMRSLNIRNRCILHNAGSADQIELGWVLPPFPLHPAPYLCHKLFMWFLYNFHHHRSLLSHNIFHHRLVQMHRPSHPTLSKIFSPPHNISSLHILSLSLNLKDLNPKPSMLQHPPKSLPNSHTTQAKLLLNQGGQWGTLHLLVLTQRHSSWLLMGVVWIHIPSLKNRASIWFYSGW